ncbi:MAG: hypothetical protein H6R16_1465, partial [Proteobacteria bacterium]|nr:hypothetical protein [Pseudomonadota bacterium]
QFSRGGRADPADEQREGKQKGGRYFLHSREMYLKNR